MDQYYFRRLISGEDQGLKAKTCRVFLAGFSLLYLCVISVRNKLYDIGILKVHSAGKPVVSIGNITTGGTGKTPLVVWLCNKLEQQGKSAAILTRGYKSAPGTSGDEPAMMAKDCPETKVIVGSDRVAGAKKAVDEYGCEVLVLDDGFQHRRLARQVDILAVDATCPFGYDRILPRGLLREPKRNISRAQAAVITRYDQTCPAKLEKLQEQLKSISNDIVIAKATHKEVCAKSFKGKEISLDELRDRKVFAFCGIGNPMAFIDRLTECGNTVVGSAVYNDHYNYTDEDIRDIFSDAHLAGADIVLTTQKDWVKVALLAKELGDIEIAYLKIELVFIEGEAGLVRLIESAMDA